MVHLGKLLKAGNKMISCLPVMKEHVNKKGTNNICFNFLLDKCFIKGCKFAHLHNPGVAEGFAKMTIDVLKPCMDAVWKHGNNKTMTTPSDIIPSPKVEQQHHFPYKLYDMLDYVADSDFSSAVSWTHDGRAFSIRDKDACMERVVPRFFKQTKFRSFVSFLGCHCTV